MCENSLDKKSQQSRRQDINSIIIVIRLLLFSIKEKILFERKNNT
jgi:hypothetical protein